MYRSGVIFRVNALCNKMKHTNLYMRGKQKQRDSVASKLEKQCLHILLCPMQISLGLFYQVHKDYMD